MRVQARPCRYNPPGRFDAQIAAGALTFDHGVHLFSGAQDGIDWAGLNAFGATDAFFFANYGDHGGFLDAVFRVQRWRFNIQKLGQRINGVLSARRTLVDLITGRNGLGVGPAAGVATLSALSLRQHFVDGVDQGFPWTRKRSTAQANNAPPSAVSRIAEPTAYKTPSNTDATKSHKGQCHDSGADHPNGGSLKGSGMSARANRSRSAANKTSTKKKPNAAPKPYSNDSKKLCALPRFEKGDAQYRTIGGNQRQKDAQHLVQKRAGF